MSGAFVISLDFELMWGVRDKRNIEQYGENIIGARKAIPMILELFKKYNIHCTWATVGLLFCEDNNELVDALPEKKPSYNNPNLSPYTYLNEIIEDETNHSYYFAHSIINLIRKYEGQEIGSHTFSHYYCDEEGQTIMEFEADMNSAISIAEKKGILLRSFIFPRNQVVSEYLIVLKKLGFKCYRGNPNSFLYNINIPEKLVNIVRGFRLIDSYLNLFGHQAYTLDHSELTSYGLINIPASTYLRPFNYKLRMFEKLKLKRIYNSMRYAAKNNKIYHLWWHPHNFGKNITQNLAQLEMILKKYTELSKKYNFASMNLSEVAEEIEKAI